MDIKITQTQVMFDNMQSAITRIVRNVSNLELSNIIKESQCYEKKYIHKYKTSNSKNFTVFRKIPL